MVMIMINCNDDDYVDYVDDLGDADCRLPTPPTQIAIFHSKLPSWLFLVSCLDIQHLMLLFYKCFKILNGVLYFYLEPNTIGNK